MPPTKRPDPSERKFRPRLNVSEFGGLIEPLIARADHAISAGRLAHADRLTRRIARLCRQLGRRQ